MIEPLLRLGEPLLVRFLRLENRWPPLFVLGAPRTGTTLVYQNLANAFRFAYLPNLSRRHPRAPASCAWAGLRAHGVPETWGSSDGRIEGPMAPSDGWEVFRRWFPTYGEKRPVQVQRLHELKTTVRLLERVFDGPFLNKNNHNSTRIDELARLFPDALFVHVRRDLCDAAASLLEARRRNRVQPGRWWSAAPPQFLGREFSSELEQVVCTLWGIDSFVGRALSRLSPERWRTVDYQEYCAAPQALAGWVRHAYQARGVRLAERGVDSPPRLVPSVQSGAERAELERQIASILGAISGATRLERP